MHYGRRTFSTNNQDTIVAKFDPNLELAGDVLSYLDRAELTKKYQCYKGTFQYTVFELILVKEISNKQTL